MPDIALRLEMAQASVKVLKAVELKLQSPTITDDEISRIADKLQIVVYGLKAFTLAGVSKEDAMRRLLGR